MACLPIEKIDLHHQRPANTCIPSAVEIILKQLGKVPIGFYLLQDGWRGSSFSDIDGKEYFGLRFKAEFTQDAYPRGPDFPLEQLLHKISNELSEGRYVVVSLRGYDSSARRWLDCYHMFVIYAEVDGEFQAVSKNGEETIRVDNVKDYFTHMGGTDILTYSMISNNGPLDV